MCHDVNFFNRESAVEHGIHKHHKPFHWILFSRLPAVGGHEAVFYSGISNGLGHIFGGYMVDSDIKPEFF